MGMNGCTRAMKYMLVFFNGLIVIGGAISIGLGAWGLASEYGAAKMKDLTGSELYRGAAIALIVGGCIMVVIAILGFLGALLENRVLLGIYFVIVLLLLILFVVVAAVGFAYRDELENKIVSQMNNTLLYHYGINTNTSDVNEGVTEVWDYIQKNLHCCGVKGRSFKSSESWFLWQKSAWFHAQSGPSKQYIPQSCCNEKFGNASLQNCTSLNGDPSRPVQIDTSGITNDNEYMYNKGCYDELKDNIKSRILAIGGIAIAIVITMFLCLLFAACLCANIGRHKLDV